MITAAHSVSSKIPRLVASLLLAVLAAGVPVAPAQDVAPPVSQALDLLSDEKFREAVAVLADAARQDPRDRKVGSLLFSLLRDKHWPIPQTLPVSLGAAITVADFSPDGVLVVAGTEDGTVRVLDVASGELTPTTIHHPAAVLAVKIGPGNQTAFSVGKAGTAILWEVSTGKVIRQWSDPEAKITAAATTPDLGLIALGHHDGRVLVYRSDSDRPLDTSLRHTQAIRGLVFSRDGATLATASSDGTARLWDVGTRKVRDFVIHHRSPLTSVDLNGSGTIVLTSSEGGIVTVSDTTTGAPILPALDCGAAILKARLSPSGVRFSTVLADHTVRIWDTPTGEPVEGIIRTEDSIADANWSPTGMRLLTASEGTTAELWRVRDGTRISEGMVHTAPVRVAIFGPAARLMATGCTDGRLRVWRQDVGAATEALPTVRTHHGPVRTAFLSPDQDAIISASDDFTALRWTRGSVRPSGLALSHEAKVACAVFNPEGSIVATVSEDGRAALWDALKGESLGPDRELGAPGRWVDFHRDSRLFATTAGTQAMIWAVDSPVPIGAAIQHRSGCELHAARFSPDGKVLATAGADNTIGIWDTASHQSLATLKKHEGDVLSVRFSFDGTLLVSTSADGSICVWNTTTWQPMGSPMVMPGEVWSAVITPDNHFVLATSLVSRGVRIFDLLTGSSFTDGISLPSDALSLDLSPGGDLLVVACTDGTIRSYGSPFVQEPVPHWFPDFAERTVGLRVTGPGRFEPVDSEYIQLQRYLGSGARGSAADFAHLARWLVSSDAQRAGMPRTRTKIADIVVQRVEERSVAALYECLESAPSDPLVLAALSLYLPDKPQAEFLAEYALARADDEPLAIAYCASTFARHARVAEAEKLMSSALEAAPDDPRVLRRAAKLDARQGRKAVAIARFEKAAAADPEDVETLRSFAWALYNLGEAARAEEIFVAANRITGGADPDVSAGLSLSSAAASDDTRAIAQYRRLVKIAAEWGDPEYIKSLSGWTARELAEMERLRALATAPR